MNEFIRIGSLVRTVSGTCHHDKFGIVTRIFYPDEHNLWPGACLVQVLYPHSGEKLKWHERCLEIISC